MKELENKDQLNQKTQIESIVKKKQEIEYRLEDSLRPMKGHTLFEINTKTLEVKKAKFITKKTIYWTEALRIANGDGVPDEIIMRPDCVYISALNKKNAMERYKNGKGSASKSKGIMDLRDLFW